MIDKELIERINLLASKKKEGTLTKEEEKEQELLRKEYIRQFKQGFKQTLDGVKVVDSSGKDVTPKKKGNA